MELQEENKKLYRLIAEQMGETESVEEDWQDYWGNATDHERVRSIFLEILSGALIAEGICTKDDAENHINKMLTAAH